MNTPDRTLVEALSIIDRLRSTCDTLRRKPTPLSDFIKLLHESADSIEALAALPREGAPEPDFWLYTHAEDETESAQLRQAFSKEVALIYDKDPLPCWTTPPQASSVAEPRVSAEQWQSLLDAANQLTAAANERADRAERLLASSVVPAESVAMLDPTGAMSPIDKETFDGLARDEQRHWTVPLYAGSVVPDRQPLSEEQIAKAAVEARIPDDMAARFELRSFARAIERAHQITKKDE